jgi:hypothetical protein
VQRDDPEWGCVMIVRRRQFRIASIISIAVLTVSAILLFWYAQVPESVLCSPRDSMGGDWFEECPEARPQLGLMIVACLLLGFGGGVILPGMAVQPHRRTRFWFVAVLVFPIIAAVAALYMVVNTALIPFTGVMFGVVLLILLLKGEPEIGIDELIWR